MKRSKYGNRRVQLDGHSFDSTAEAKRYGELKLMERAGLISGLEVHPRIDLHASNGVKIGAYEADFRYLETGKGVRIEDVKGVRTDLFKWKARHFKAEYGIEIIEVRA